MNSFLYLRYLPGESPNTHSKLISTPPYVIYILVACQEVWPEAHEGIQIQ